MSDEYKTNAFPHHLNRIKRDYREIDRVRPQALALTRLDNLSDVFWQLSDVS